MRSRRRFDQAGKLVAEVQLPQRPTQLAARSGSRTQGRRRGDIVTIALVPAGVPAAVPALVSPLPTSRSGPAPAAAASAAAVQLGVALRDTLAALFGPTLHLTSTTVEALFPTAFERMGTAFYRSKITSWMAAQEEDYRYTATRPHLASCMKVESSAESNSVSPPPLPRPPGGTSPQPACQCLLIRVFPGRLSRPVWNPVIIKIANDNTENLCRFWKARQLAGVVAWGGRWGAAGS